MIEYGIGKPFSPLFNIEECSLICIQRSEENFNEMMQSIGIDEINAYAESGQYVVYESFDIKQIKDKVIDWFKKILEDIKAAVDKALKTIKEKIDDFTTKVDKKVGDIMRKLGANAKLIKTDNVLGSWYTYDKLEDAINGKFNGVDIWGTLRNTGMQLYAKSASIKFGNDLKDDKVKVDEEYLVPMFKKFGFGDTTKITNIVPKIKKVLMGEKKQFKKGDLTGEFDINKLADQATSFTANKNKVAKEYQAVKKLFDDYIKGANKAFAKDRSMVGLKDCISGLKTASHIATAFNGAILGCIISRLSRNMAMTIRVAISIKNKAESTNESFSYGNVQSEISSLFSF